MAELSLQRCSEIIHEETLKAMQSAMRLKDLAHAFSEVGNNPVSRKLYDEAQVIMETQDKLSETWGKTVDIMFETAGQSSKNVLNAALAGIQLGKGEVKPKT